METIAATSAFGAVMVRGLRPRTPSTSGSLALARSPAALGGELHADTEAGADMVAAATCFAEDFTAGAFAHDRDGTFAVEHLQKLRADGYLNSPVPRELGGGGVASVHDVLVASSRLARGDASTAIGVNMHFAVLVNVVRSWRIAVARGEERKAAAMADGLRWVTAADVVFAAAASEPSPQDLTRPSTTATRLADGWAINGRKAFATMASAATILNVAVTYVNAQGEERYGFALVPSATSGVVFHDDWDALGMRASASGSISFEDVRIGTDALRDGFPAGTYSAALLDRYLPSGAFHAAASLGIAEAAHANVVTTLRRRVGTVVNDPHAITELADNVVDLAAMRASFDRAGHLLDGYFAAHVSGETALDAAQAMYGEVQSCKAFLTATAVRVVDRALALSGGAGYLAKHPLAKAWRDVRAGGFMHPIGANRAGAILARTALGVTLDESC
jgi:alkylation response protein AidB-like acyl-CoA dehydrogenase